MNWGALFNTFRLGVASIAAQPSIVLAQFGIYWALLVSYSAILRAIPLEDLARLNITSAQLIWYVAGTEIIVCCAGSFALREMEEEIENGALEVMLLRPVNFCLLKLSEYFGRYIVSLGMFMPFSLGLGYILSGAWPKHFAAIIVFMICSAAGALMLLSVQLIIACIGVWWGKSRVLYWVWQKMFFLLGALLWPLLFYPGSLQIVAWLTPFPAMVATSGNAMAGVMAGWQILHQIIWLAIAMLVIVWMSSKVRKRILLTGG